VDLGHEVIVVDREQSKLDSIKSKQIITICGDISTDEGRLALRDRLLSEYPQVNVLINNAAVNPCPPLLKDTTNKDWEMHKMEFQVNLLAPMHLSVLLLPHLSMKPNALIMNVTSIFAYFPIAFHPTYCATKAALHSFTLSMRHQLKDTAVRVVELIPPLVESPLLIPAFKGKGVDTEEFVNAAMQSLLRDEVEISYKSDDIVHASRDELDKKFEEWNSTYGSCYGKGDGQSLSQGGGNSSSQFSQK